MVAKFSPLDFPAMLHDLPQNYAQRISLFDGEGNFIARQHMDRFEDFIDLAEVDYDDSKIRLFAQLCLVRKKGGLNIFLQDLFSLLRLFKIFLLIGGKTKGVPYRFFLSTII